MNAYHVQPAPRSLMADFVAAHRYAVRVSQEPYDVVISPARTGRPGA
jgi:hypothetical protein